MNKWQKFSEDNAEYYILTIDGVDYSTEEGQKFFYESGKKHCAEMFGRIEHLLTEKDSVLEIGCGIGRILLPNAEIFKNASGVDISKGMLEKLMLNCKKRNLDNVTPFLSSEHWYKTSFYDYIYSFIVFQHIDEYSIIQDYIQKISKSLKISGVAQLQFDTRKADFAYSIRNNLPDFLLPKSQKKGIRRIRRNVDVLKNEFLKNGLKIISELGKNTSEHIFILRREI